jgi:DNA-binding response OmpR family regulator
MAQSVLPQESPLLAPAEAGAKKILLAIDDDPEVLRLLRDGLTGTGFAMVGASSGEEGLALARKLKPYVITLDIMMPHALAGPSCRR